MALTIARSGLAPARASLSARQAKAMGLLTSGTFGLTSSISSASSDLSMSLANRLQQVTQTHGSTLYRQTWKEWDTPSGLVPFTSAGIGAPHIRERAYWVAHASGGRYDRRTEAAGQARAGIAIGVGIGGLGNANVARLEGLGGMAASPKEREEQLRTNFRVRRS